MAKRALALPFATTQLSCAGSVAALKKRSENCWRWTSASGLDEARPDVRVGHMRGWPEHASRLHRVWLSTRPSISAKRALVSTARHAMRSKARRILAAGERRRRRQPEEGGLREGRGGKGRFEW